MVARGLEPILVRVTIPLPMPVIFKAFVQERQLENWMCDRAVVEPHVGGRYELAFSAGTIPFVSTGKITRIMPNSELVFTFLGPPHLNGGLLSPDGRSEVYLRLRESPDGVDVTAEHGGWKDSDAGEEARAWHAHHWDERLDALKTYLTETAVA
jgi:uncharacterized protein YndB with AHSA1/START domain